MNSPTETIDEAAALCADGEYEAAVNQLAAVIAELESAGDADQHTLALAHRGLADAHACLGHLKRAGQAADSAIALFEASASRDPALALALHTRAVVHLESDELPAAIQALDRAAEVVEGGGHLEELATVLLTMAEVGNATGNSADAVSLYERVLDDLQKAAPKSPEHAATLNAITAKAFFGLGSTAARVGDADEAKDYLARSVAFFEAGFGHGHPEMRVALREIAAIYRYLGEEGAAAALEEELATADEMMADAERERDLAIKDTEPG